MSVVTLFLFCFVLCSHTPIISEHDEKNILSEIRYKIDLSNGKWLEAEIETAKRLLSKKTLNHDEVLELEHITQIYLVASRLDEQEVNLPPQSSVAILLPSFCLDPTRAPPSEDEVYSWKNEVPDVPYYSALLGHAAKEGQENIQELMWNLRQNVRFADYPTHLKVLLKEVDPNVEGALLKRRLKGQAIQVIEDKAKQLSGIDELQDQYQYQTYGEIASALSKRISVKPLSAKNYILPVGGVDSVYSTSQSNSYHNQNVALFNPSAQWKKISLPTFHLMPARSEVQRLGVYAHSGNALSKIIENALKDTIVRNSQYWYRGNSLQDAERSLIQKYPMEALSVYIQAQKAKFSMYKYFLRDGEDDESDAFRHFMWSGLLTQQLGAELALKFLNAHEAIITKKTSKEEKDSTEMDSHNNSVGVKAAIELKNTNDLTWKNLEKVGIEKLENRALRVLHEKAPIVYPH